MTVIKRDGTKCEFQAEKIKQAILKAFKAVDGDLSDYAYAKANNIANYIEEWLSSEGREIGVEEIQDMVENGLMSTKRKDVARAYIQYRAERSRIRERNSEIRRIVKEKMSASNVQNQNANVDEHSFGGRMGEANSAVMRQLALDEYVSETSKRNHLENRVYIHDLDHWVAGDHNCLSIPFDDLLANGFNTRQTDVRPANSVNTAFQLVAVIFQLQSLQQFGGVSATHLDWTMVPYVRKSFYKHYKDGMNYIPYDIALVNGIELNSSLPIDNNDYKILDKIYNYALDMTEREIIQAVEGMYHNLNTLQSRSGNQLPFTSINYGTCTLLEGRMIIKALLDGSIKGLGKRHRTSIFPCGIFQIMKGVNKESGTPNYDLKLLALKSTATRLYPNYANVDWSGNAGYDKQDPRTYFSTMGKCKCSSFKIF